MRKILFIVSLCICTPILAQPYKPLLDNYNEWQFTGCNFGCLTDTYYTNGDTLVDGVAYKVLDGYHFISRSFLLREEIPAKTVFLKYVQPSGNNEYLLYDFSLAVGDSIDMKNPISPFPTNAGYFRLDSIIPRLLIDGNEYRHFYLSPSESNTVSTNNAVWVEGVGSLSLINAPSGEPNINESGHLSCFFKNSELFYSNLDSISGCEPLIVLETTTFSNPLSELKLISNTTNNQFTFYTAENVHFVAIFDVRGRKLNVVQPNGQSEFQINFSTYKAGVYLLIAYSKNFEKRTFRVVVK